MSDSTVTLGFAAIGTPVGPVAGGGVFITSTLLCLVLDGSAHLGGCLRFLFADSVLIHERLVRHCRERGRLKRENVFMENSTVLCFLQLTPLPPSPYLPIHPPTHPPLRRSNKQLRHPPPATRVAPSEALRPRPPTQAWRRNIPGILPASNRQCNQNLYSG